MLGFFTDPYPDELLYSALARYSDRARYPNRKNVLMQVFGNDKISAIVDFPTRLDNFVETLPEGNLYKTDEIINKHTLFPFYEPFLSPEKAMLVRNEMTNSTENKIHSRLGLKINQIKTPDYLRFCPICLNNDRSKFGETYWHRVHQIAGIIVCPRHQCFLENSNLPWDRKLGYHFFSAEKFVKLVAPVYIDNNNKNHQIFLKLSKDTEWLLSQNNLQLGAAVLRHRYLNQLIKLGFAYYNGNIRHKKFFDTFHKICTPELFEMIGRISKSDNWVIALLQKGNIDITYHPIRHLLLVTFLGLTIEEFVNSFIEFKPFRDPPYPCLNVASNHYGELRIHHCKISDNISKDPNKQGIPLGIFTCDCGFTYQRLGPDKTEKDRYTYSLIKEYGEVWEEKLRNLWADLRLSSSQIAKQLGTSQTSIGRHAIRLNLPMNTEKTRSLQGYDRHRNPNDSFSTLVQKYRKDWLEVWSKNPNSTRKELLKITNFLYLWLKKNDSEWFQDHIPKIVRNPYRKNRLDWTKIDKQLCRKVTAICDEILNIDSFPVRICITEIIKRVGHKGWLEKRERKLPDTDKVITEKLESLESFMIRKVLWATERSRRQGRIPTEAQLRAKAVVNNKTSQESEKVQQIIKKSLEDLRNNSS